MEEIKQLYVYGCLRRRKKRHLYRQKVSDRVHISGFQLSLCHRHKCIWSGHFVAFRRMSGTPVESKFIMNPAASTPTSTCRPSLCLTAIAIWTLPHRSEARLSTHQWASNPEAWMIQMCRARGRFTAPVCWWLFFIFMYSVVCLFLIYIKTALKIHFVVVTLGRSLDLLQLMQLMNFHACNTKKFGGFFCCKNAL